MVHENLLIIFVLLPFLAALATATLPITARNGSVLLTGLTLAAMLGLLGALVSELPSAGAITRNVHWVDQIQLVMRFRIDGFSALFAGLVAGLGLLIVIYARFYLAAEDPAPRFYASMLGFAGAMSGMVLSGNIIMLVIFWELTSYMSSLLISYWNHRPDARDGARHALIITVAGGLFLLAAMILLGRITGSYDIETVIASGDVIRGHSLYPLVLVLFLLGAFTKSAQFPFHFWLPGAMAAPTPVSAFLHSATLVKAGVYLVLRFAPALSGTTLWLVLVAGTGVVTMVIGAAIAMFHNDIKRLLAYSTVSHLGMIIALAGIGTPFAIAVAVFHIFNHAMFKAALFMTAGMIEHGSGSRDLRRLSGLRRLMPITATIGIITGAAMAGLPLLNGFLSKEMFLDAAHQLGMAGTGGRLFTALAVLGAAGGVAYSLRLVITAFFGPAPEDLPIEPHDPPALMWLPVALLAAVCVLVGLMPAMIEPALNAVTTAILGDAAMPVSLRIWHGVNPALILSLAGFAVGGVLYAGLRADPVMPWPFSRINATAIFERILLLTTRKLPQMLTEVFSLNRLQSQLRAQVLLAMAVGLALLPGATEWWPETPVFTMQEALFSLLWIVGGGCAIGAAWQAKYHRFAALILLSGAGLVTCITFVWLSAPDLAVTQLLVEIVTTVLLLLGLRWLPQRSERILGDRALPARVRRLRDLLIAIFGGTGIAAMAYAIMAMPSGMNVGDWFLRHAYIEGGGTNVVNVILVDFRAFDTLGEITVLAIVALTVFVLLRRFRPAPESATLPPAQWADDDSTLRDYLHVAAIIMHWMFAATILMAAYLFFRGHDLPGGGFTAGVTLAIGLLLQYLATNVRLIEARLIILPVRWMAAGLVIAAGMGIGSWLFGYPFLTQTARMWEVPFVGEVPAATALIFDLGVFMVVVGATVLILIAIAHQSLRVGGKIRARTEDVGDAGVRPMTRKRARDNTKTGKGVA